MTQDNTTRNTLQNDTSYIPPEQVFHMACESVILGMIVLGNCSVLISNGQVRKSSRMRFFILNLAFSDLMVGLLAVLPNLILRVTREFHGGVFLCKIVRAIQNASTFGGTYALVSLSIDRLDAIARPLRATSGTKARQSLIIVAVAWFFAFGFSTPPLHFAQIVYKSEHGGNQCWMVLQRNQWQVYFTLIMVTVFIIPATIIFAANVATVYIIYHAGRLNHTASQRDTKASGCIPKAKIRTVIMTFVIVTTFVVCWSPYCLFNMLTVYGAVKNVPLRLSIFMNQLATLNSAANPIIYWLFNFKRCSKEEGYGGFLPCIYQKAMRARAQEASCAYYRSRYQKVDDGTNGVRRISRLDFV